MTGAITLSVNNAAATEPIAAGTRVANLVKGFVLLRCSGHRWPAKPVSLQWRVRRRIHYIEVK